MITGFTNYIYPQKNCIFNFFWNNEQNNWSGNFEIVSNANQNLNINFVSGKIFDENNFIYSFQPQSVVNISGNYSENYFNIFLNDQYIYSKTGIFGKASGFSFNWTTGYSWDSQDFFPKTFFYGELPIIDFIYENSGFSTDDIEVTLSGNKNNNGPFILYSGEIGRNSNFNNNIQSLYFGISGVNDWSAGIEIDKNQIFNFNIIQLQDRLPFVDTYIPLILHTNAGIIGRNLFISRYKKSPAQDLLLSINPSTSISEANSLLRSSFIFDLTFKNTDKETSEAYIFISGYEGNNINQNGYQDTFTGSWSLIIDGQNALLTGELYSGKMNIRPNIFEQNKKIEVYKQIEQPNQNIGFTGSAFYSISGNNFYKTGVLGSSINIFREYYSYTV
jgi:hypothetical protein